MTTSATALRDRPDTGVVLTDRFARALTYTSAINSHRASTDTAHMAHLLGVASLVLEAGGDEDLAIAALLHDAVRYSGGERRLEDIRQRFGDGIAGTVMACHQIDSPSLASADARVRALAEADDGVLVVYLADRVHEARSLVTRSRSDHEGVTTGSAAPAHRNEQVRYLDECLRVGRQRAAPATVTIPLSAAVEELLAGHREASPVLA